MNRPSCPPRQVLLAYQTGALTEATAESVISHVTTCADCQAELATMDQAGDPLVESLRAPVPAELYANEPQLARMLQNARSLRVGDPSVVQASGEPTLNEPPRERLGEYELLAKLGEGGMGAVYKARQTNLDRLVALKVLPKDRSENKTAIARFYREMRAVGRLSHPNIVQAIDAREIDGSPVLAMEYVDGLDLSKLVSATGTLRIADACELIRQAAVGLQHAHEQGLVHRDIKPSNLMLNRQATVKILDLGLALLGPNQPSHQEMTSAGTAMGTADYVSPEQATDSHSVDIRADIYSLGCTLYKLLTGRAPFADAPHKKPLEVMLSHLQKPMPSVRVLRPEAPEKLALVIERMTAKRPSERFATPAEVAAALEPFAAGCDLIRLASQPGAKPGLVEPVRPATDQYVSSALTGTTPSQSSPVALVAAPIAASGRGSGRRRLWIGLAAAAAIPLLFGIWVVVRDNTGKELGRIQVPEGGSATLVDDQGKPVTGGKPSEVPSEKPTPQPAGTAAARKAPQPVSIDLTPEPLDLPAGAPMSKMALVAQPAAIPGVRSWTMETTGHRGSIEAVTYSPDGRILATASADGAIRLWDSTSNKLLRAILGHDGKVNALSWSRDGKFLASAGADATVRLWNAESGLHQLTLRGKVGFSCVAWSPAGPTLAAGDDEGSISFWKFTSPDPASSATPARDKGWAPVQRGVAVRILKNAFPPRVVAVAWSADGTILASSAQGAGGVRLWDSHFGTLSKEFGVPGNFPDAGGLVWSPDGAMVAIAGKPLPGIWDSQTGKMVPWVKDLEPVTSFAFYNLLLAWSPDGRRIARSSADAIHVFDVEGRKNSPSRPFPAPIVSRCLAYSPDGEKLAAGYTEGTVVVWKEDSRKIFAESPGHEGGTASVAWSPDGNAIVAWNGARIVSRGRIWDSRTGCLVRELAPEVPNNHAQQTPWSPDGKRIATTHGSLIEFWDASVGERSEVVSVTGWVAYDIAWSPDGKVVAVNNADGQLAMYDAVSRKPRLTLQAQNVGLTFSPDGTRLALGGEAAIRICDPRDGKVLDEIPTPGIKPYRGNTSPLCWSPDTAMIALASDDKKLYIIDVKSKRMAATCEGHKNAAARLGWARDSRTLISGSETEVCVWEAATGKLLRTISDDGGAISADGRLVASRGESAIRIRQVEDGKVLRTIVSLRDKQYLAISPDGHFRGSPDVEQEFVYVVQTDEGQQTLTPAEFAKKYNWKNDPSKVQRAEQPEGQKPAESGGPAQSKPAASKP